MKAIDTNIIVRFLTGENHPQTEIARDVIAAQQVFVCDTVLLESAWVLRSAYGFAQADIIRALRAFAGLDNVTLENSDRLVDALTWAEAGMDPADAMHLAAYRHCESLLTFDKRFIRAAMATAAPKVTSP